MAVCNVSSFDFNAQKEILPGKLHPVPTNCATCSSLLVSMRPLVLFLVCAASLMLSPVYFKWTVSTTVGFADAKLMTLPRTPLSRGSDQSFSASFLPKAYRTKGSDNTVFSVRQVPGDGGCLFHAITAWITYLQTGNHMDYDWRMRNLSQKLRHLAVRSLQKQNITYVLEHGEVIEPTALLEMISDVYGLQPAEYCGQLLDPRTWGGGPEIVALSNHFKCPIHVYQLSSGRKFYNPFTKPTFELEVCAKFGSPNFDDKEPITLLCADGRFAGTVYSIQLSLTYVYGMYVGSLISPQDRRKRWVTISWLCSRQRRDQKTALVAVTP
jgi:hypothetical protein